MDRPESGPMSSSAALRAWSASPEQASPGIERKGTLTPGSKPKGRASSSETIDAVSHSASSSRGPVVISGGTGFNSLVSAVSRATYVMPISDDGGSSSEIIRVLGGPSLGDIRSRLVRLIPLATPADTSASTPRSNEAVHRLLSYRLPSSCGAKDAKHEWLSIVEGRHALWRGIEADRKECIRGFLVHFEAEVLRRANRRFEFRGASVGNCFLAAAQKFFRSVTSAIFLFSVTAQLDSSSGNRVVPVINTNHTCTIAAELENEEIIVGQCQISHPARSPAASSTTSSSLNALQPGTPASVILDPLSDWKPSASSWQSVGNRGDGLEPEEDDLDVDEDEEELVEPHQANVASLASSLRNIVFSKQGEGEEADPALPARIKRIFYVNAYRQEVFPRPNPEVLTALSSSDTLVYSCGSLWTSIIPCLTLRGLASAIARSPALRSRVLLLNTTHDRETYGLDASDFVRVIVDSLNRSDDPTSTAGHPPFAASELVSHIVYYPDGDIKVDVADLEALGIRCIDARKLQQHRAPDTLPSHATAPRFDEHTVRAALQSIEAERPQSST